MITTNQLLLVLGGVAAAVFTVYGINWLLSDTTESWAISSETLKLMSAEQQATVVTAIAVSKLPEVLQKQYLKAA